MQNRITRAMLALLLAVGLTTIVANTSAKEEQKEDEGQKIAFTELPAVVQTAVTNYFGSATGLAAEKEVEDGKTFFEVEGQNDGGEVTVKLSEDGKIVEEEKANDEEEKDSKAEKEDDDKD